MFVILDKVSETLGLNSTLKKKLINGFCIILMYYMVEREKIQIFKPLFHVFVILNKVPETIGLNSTLV